MLAAFQNHINSKFPFLKDKKLLIAVSGGIDSVVLTHLLHRSDFDSQLAHCNFRLRGKESDQDEQFVIDIGKKLRFKVYTGSFDTEHYAKDKKLSVQMAARQLRYNWFKQLLQENKRDYLITAHNLDDNLETFLINFTRGTGLDGLTGIPEKNDTVVRPLLAFSRKQIEKYAQENNITWREDASNAEAKYTRNKVRHEVIPLLKEINPGLLDAFRQTIEYLQQSREIIDSTVNELKKNIVIPAQAGIHKIDIQKIKELSNQKGYLYELLKTYNFTEWNDVANLLNAQPGKQLFSETHRLIKDRDCLLLEPLLTQTKPNFYIINKGEAELKTAGFSIRVSEKKILTKKNHTELLEALTDSTDTIFVDADTLKFPLELRKWQEGDYFYPLGMQGKKKVSKFFKDEKYSLIDKENTWVLCSGNNILWIVGKRMDDRFKITKNTKKITQIDYCK